MKWEETIKENQEKYFLKKLLKEQEKSFSKILKMLLERYIFIYIIKCKFICLFINQAPLDGPTDTTIVFLDKNHPPSAIQPTIELIAKSSPTDFDVKIVALIPECYENFSIQEKKYPFSLTMIMNCW